MAASDDPKTTIRNAIVANLGAISDDDGNPAAYIILWESGPEVLKYLFFGAPLGGPYDIVITLGEPRSRSIRPIQDVPVHFLMRYPITVTTVDKYDAAAPPVLYSTAAEMQYKVTWALRTLVFATTAQSFTGAAPAYTMRLIEDVATHKRIGGLDVWQATHSVEYKTS